MPVLAARALTVSLAPPATVRAANTDGRAGVVRVCQGRHTHEAPALPALCRRHT